jgi:ABC-type transport system substrate-binding protein
MWSVPWDDPNVQKRDFALTDWGTQDPIYAVWAEVTGPWPPDGGNATFTDDPEMVSLIDQAWATTDPEERLPILHQLQDHIADNGYRIFILEQSQVYGLKEGVTGFKVNPNHHLDWRSIDWA